MLNYFTVSPHTVVLVILFFSAHISSYHISKRRDKLQGNHFYGADPGGIVSADNAEHYDDEDYEDEWTEDDTTPKMPTTASPPVTWCRSLTSHEKRLAMRKCRSSGSIPIRNECKVFIFCARPGAMPVRSCCPKGLYFDHQLERCIDKNQAECIDTHYVSHGSTVHSDGFNDNSEGDDDDERDGIYSGEDDNEDTDEDHDHDHDDGGYPIIRLTIPASSQWELYPLSNKLLPWPKNRDTGYNIKEQVYAIPVVFTNKKLPKNKGQNSQKHPGHHSSSSPQEPVYKPSHWNSGSGESFDIEKPPRPLDNSNGIGSSGNNTGTHGSGKDETDWYPDFDEDDESVENRSNPVPGKQEVTSKKPSTMQNRPTTPEPDFYPTFDENAESSSNENKTDARTATTANDHKTVDMNPVFNESEYMINATEQGKNQIILTPTKGSAEYEHKLTHSSNSSTEHEQNQTTSSIQGGSASGDNTWKVDMNPTFDEHEFLINNSNATTPSPSSSLTKSPTIITPKSTNSDDFEVAFDDSDQILAPVSDAGATNTPTKSKTSKHAKKGKKKRSKLHGPKRNGSTQRNHKTKAHHRKKYVSTKRPEGVEWVPDFDDSEDIDPIKSGVIVLPGYNDQGQLRRRRRVRRKRKITRNDTVPSTTTTIKPTGYDVVIIHTELHTSDQISSS